MLLPGPLPPGLSHAAAAAAAAATSSPHSTELTGGKGFQPDTSVAANELSQYTCSIIPPPIYWGLARGTLVWLQEADNLKLEP